MQTKPWENSKASPTICMGKCASYDKEELEFEEEPDDNEDDDE
ncbi:MAG: hypothetical protein PHU71_03255 [Candidatus Gracilibacteria bacterium]|nr:hypothetical protein [Candidatus Gracilibacteria bacterium]